MQSRIEHEKKKKGESCSWSERKEGELEGRARRQPNVYTLEELGEEVIMQHSLKLMNNMFLKITSEGRGEAEG